MPNCRTAWLLFVLSATVLTVIAAADDAVNASRGIAEGQGTALFNGQDLSGWQSRTGGRPGEGWVVADGALVRQARSGDIWTAARYGDFVLDLEFKTEGNSGVFIRTDDPRNNVQTGIEIQVDNPSNNPGKHSCGAVYDAVPPSKNAARRGEWNRLVITARDNRLLVVMNDEQIIDMDLDRWTEAGKNPDGSRNKFRTALKDFKREGHIGFQDHGGKVAYRNVRIQRLEE